VIELEEFQSKGKGLYQLGSWTEDKVLVEEMYSKLGLKGLQLERGKKKGTQNQELGVD
jgi:hypothetical protein